MPEDLIDEKSTLIQVMAWCRQATSHYLKQCWPGSMTPNGVTRGHWVNVSVPHFLITQSLAHWGRATHICVGKLTIIGSDNGLAPGRCQAIIWTSAGISLNGPLGTNFNETLIWIQHFHSRKCIWKCRLRNGVHLSQPQCVDNTILHMGRPG